MFEKSDDCAESYLGPLGALAQPIAIHALADSPLDTSVIIVNYNTRAMTLGCLRTVYAALDGMSAEVFVVDNASTDGSLTAIHTEFPQVITIANTKNVGFGAANNQAMAKARGRYFLLLNSDAFPERGSIRILCQYLDDHPTVGIVAPRLVDKDSVLQISCYRFPSPARSWAENTGMTTLFPDSKKVGDYRRWSHDMEREVDWIIGACLLIRREVVEAVGGFDPKFFMYVEETDFQKRVREKGFQIAFNPRAQVAHIGHASSTGNGQINTMALASIDYYTRKHFGLWGLLLVRSAMAFGGIIRGVIWLARAMLSHPRRAAHWNKAKLHLQIFVRQLTHWRLT